MNNKIKTIIEYLKNQDGLYIEDFFTETLEMNCDYYGDGVWSVGGIIFETSEIFQKIEDELIQLEDSKINKIFKQQTPKKTIR